MRIHTKSYIEALSIYQPPWDGLERRHYLRLDLNEYTKELPVQVKNRLKGFIDEDGIPIYPDYRKFLISLAHYTQVSQDCLIITNGSDQAIEIILRAFLGVDDEMVMAQPGFQMFIQIAQCIGAKVKGIPYAPDLTFPYQGLSEAINQETKLIVFINPDNPTGVSVSVSFIQEMAEKHPDIPVLIDEAYFEFTGKTALPFLETHSNVIITRTFSKAFAMAGLRLGYIIAHPHLITQFNKIRGPFDVNCCALIAAEAQLDFPELWKGYVHETMGLSKPFLEDFFKDNRVHYFPGGAHFMLIYPKYRDRSVDYLKKHGILVRPIRLPPIEKTFRMNVGTLDQTKEFCTVYKQYLKELENRG